MRTHRWITTAVRYERDRPGELVHVDGKIPDGGGWKAHGRQMGSTGAKTRARIGYDYVHSTVDDHSRLAYSEILPDEKGPTCAAFLLRAAEYFAAYGITQIERVLTDNHWSYRRSVDVHDAIAALGAKHKFIKPHCHWQNGKVQPDPASRVGLPTGLPDLRGTHDMAEPTQPIPSPADPDPPIHRPPASRLQAWGAHRLDPRRRPRPAARAQRPPAMTAALPTETEADRHGSSASRD